MEPVALYEWWLFWEPENGFCLFHSWIFAIVPAPTQLMRFSFFFFFGRTGRYYEKKKEENLVFLDQLIKLLCASFFFPSIWTVIYRWQQAVPPKMDLLRKMLAFSNFLYTILVLNYSCVGFMVSTSGAVLIWILLL